MNTNSYIIGAAEATEYAEYVQKMLNKMQKVIEGVVDRGSQSDIEVKFFCEENAKVHQTFKYEMVYEDRLVIRRGQPFKMAVAFPDESSISKYSITLDFSFGFRPNPEKGSYVRLQVTESQEFTLPATQWDVKREGDGSGNELILQVQVPALIGVGVWNVKTILVSQGNNPVEIENDIFILFNPWCKEDTVFMEDDNDKNEYILNASGRVYCGTHDKITPRPWVFGQFAGFILPTCMYLLDLTGLLYNARSNPVLVTRLISNMANQSSEEGDKGILRGKWDGNYLDGTPPGIWTGSAPILEEFLNSGLPVKYGQCWVFSGLATTICRAIGIPARSVTCYLSGHDTDETLTIDIVVDTEGKRISAISDSIWSFHVWTEVWMERLDLPSGYGGWQVIDGTPQEKSENAFQLGPCPVKAVKNGEVGVLYDALFVFAEVNADFVNWILKENGIGQYRSSVSSDFVGKMVLTKKVINPKDPNQNPDEAEDITLNYKYAEGTAEERQTVNSATQIAGKAVLLEEVDTEKDVKMELIQFDSIMIGEDFQMSLKLENQSSEVRTVSISLSCSSVYYTGVVVSTIKQEKKTETLQANEQEKTVTSEMVHADEYVSSLVEQGMIKITAVATISETDRALTGEHVFVVEKPQLTLEIPSELKVGATEKLRVVFKNPLKITLTRCQFSVEGPGLIEYLNRDRGDINSEEEVTEEFDITAPSYSINTALVAAFSSEELSDVTGSKDVNVIK